jgi:transposase
VRCHQARSGAMIALPIGVRIWIAAGHTDMRRGMNRLARGVQRRCFVICTPAILYIFRGRQRRTDNDALLQERLRMSL